MPHIRNHQENPFDEAKYTGPNQAEVYSMWQQQQQVLMQGCLFHGQGFILALITDTLPKFDRQDAKELAEIETLENPVRGVSG